MPLGSARGQVDRVVANYGVFADFEPQRIEEHPGYIVSSGQACKAPTLAITASVTQQMNLSDKSTPH